MKQDIKYNIISFQFRNKATFNKFVKQQIRKKHKGRRRRDSSCGSRRVSRSVSRSTSPDSNKARPKNTSIFINDKEVTI